MTSSGREECRARPLRLPSSWRSAPLSEFAHRLVRRNSENNDNVLTISAQHGLVSQRNFFNKFVASADLSGYYLLERGEFAYNKSYSKGYPVGAIKRLEKYPKGVVSPLYICFSLDDLAVADPDYLIHFFESGLFDGEIHAIAKEGARNHGLLNVKPDEFFELRVVLPPLPEQRKIAAILSSVDEAIEKTQAVIDQLQVVKKAMMQELLTRGLPGRHTRFKMTEIGEVPESWEVARLGAAAVVGNGSTPSRQRSDYWEEGVIPWLPTGKVNDRIITAAEEFITEKALDECPVKLLPEGTLLVAMIGQGKTRGKVAYMAIEATINQNFAFIKPGSRLRSWFLFAFLDHQYASLRGSGRGSNQDALNCTIIKDYPIPVPPLEEQRRIEDVLLVSEKRIDGEQESLTGFFHIRAALMSVLLTGEVRVKVEEEVA